MLAGALLCAAFAAPAEPAQAPDSDAQVKAEFILNFTRFTEWPTDAFSTPSEPFNVCVAGTSGAASPVERAVQGERVGAHEIAFHRLTGTQGAGRCHVLYITDGARAQMAALARVATRALIVGESPRFLEQGGMINFVVEEGRVRFDVNAASATARGLRLSSRLMSLARRTDASQRQF
jgi:hypothetical protein